MNRRLELLLLATAIALAAVVASRVARDGDAPVTSAVGLVDPLIGTDGDGNVFPGAAAPFGMIQWSPDTTSAAGGYRYGHAMIRGFSTTHYSGAGCKAFQDFPFMPFVGEPDSAPSPDNDAYASGFSHDRETASPGSYTVELASGISVELTTTLRTGLGRFTFPASKPASIVLDVTGSAVQLGITGGVEIEGDRTVHGWVTSGKLCARVNQYKVFFVAELDRPFDRFGTWSAGVRADGQRHAEGPRAGAFVTFAASANRVVRMRVGLSYVSAENARANLRAESPSFDFDARRAAARAEWDAHLRAIVVSGGTDSEKRIFYTALYRSFLHPNVFSDVNGQYMGFDRAVHSAEGYTHYANFAAWDAYRTHVPLLALLDPRRTSDMMQSLVNDAKQCGALPKWASANDEAGVMEGSSADAMVATAHAFGARRFDAEAALATMVDAATRPGAKCNFYVVRSHLATYEQLGFIPEDHSPRDWGPASSTLEYAVDDFAISQLAGALGKQDVRDRFLARSERWRNLFNPKSGYLEPRRADGTFLPDFTPTAVEQQWYVEGNGAQYTWFVPHDLRGLFDRMGGNEAVVRRLDEHLRDVTPARDFEAAIRSPLANMGNEPSFATPWAYDFAGAPSRTQAVVRKVMTTHYAAGRGAGLDGNDDLGAKSAWYVWAALGMYPAIPGAPVLALNSPLFPRARIRLAGGRVFEIRGVNAAANAPFVQALEVNGVAHGRPWISADVVTKGGSMTSVLGPSPNERWGSAPADAPPSFRTSP